MTATRSAAAAGAGLVLATLATGQFLMTLDSSVMNVSIAYVAEDLGTTVTGIQTAITLYTLVMASLMIVGGKVGAIIGRKRAFAIGSVIYGAGSLTTALSPTLPVMLVGWSLLEGIGAALIMPAIVALVASNFPAHRRAAAYGLIAAAGAMAVAVGPIVGGAVTTFATWRLVFAGEVVVVAIILLLVRRVSDAPVKDPPRLDVIGAVLSATGLALAVFGVLRTSEWGWLRPAPGAPDILGLSPVPWLIGVGLFVLWLLWAWTSRLEERGGEPLLRPSMLRNSQLQGGLVMFLFQFLIQAGVFFTIPLFLSVILGLSALETGVRLLPLSIGLLATAILVPKLLPRANPRRVVQAGLLMLLGATVSLIVAMDPDATAEIVTLPLLVMGLGVGALASQLGAVTVSAVPDEQGPEAGGLQNTALNLGASLGTALVGSVLIASLTAGFIEGVMTSPSVPETTKVAAQDQLGAGLPFLSDAQLEAELSAAGVDGSTTSELVAINAAARISGLDSALAVVAIVAVIALFLTRRIPVLAPGSAPALGSAPPPGGP
jgi:MFS family permease